MTGKSWNRALAVFNTVIAAAMWPLFLILALRDWTLIIVPLVVTAGVTLQWVGLRMTYVPERPRPDYSAIAAMEREVYGEMFRHEGAPGRHSPGHHPARGHRGLRSLAPGLR